MVKIITDTTACIQPETAQRYQIPVIPQIINFGNESLYEGIDIDTEAFMARLRKSKDLPKTAAPPPELFVEQFQRLGASGEPILCIHPSSEVSGTVRSALIARQDFLNLDIRVFDTRSIASPLGTMVECAAQWSEQGLGIDEIITRLESMRRRCRIYFLVATLEFLARGGRIGNATALLGSILQVKPILRMHEGKVDQYERERTHHRAVERLKELVLQQIPKDGSGYLSVFHAGVPDEGRQLANELAALVNQPEVPVTNMPPAIVTHGGPGILAAGFFVSE